MTRERTIPRYTNRMSKLLLLILITIPLWSNNVDTVTRHPLLTRDPPIPDPPNSSDVQKLTEALYFGGPTAYDEVFPNDKQPVDVCTLSTDEAMKVCSKAEQQFPHRGSYFPISDEKVAECKRYKIKLHHNLDRPTYKDEQVRKCPLQPNPLFLLTGNKRVPIFILTWSGDEKTDLHLDFYMNFDKDLL